MKFKTRLKLSIRKKVAIKLETTQNDRLLPIDEILNLSLEEIKEDLDENAKESQIILSCVVLASRAVMNKNKIVFFIRNSIVKKADLAFCKMKN